MDKKELEIVRDLARRVAQEAAKPEMQERKKLWIENNGLRYTRPPVNIDQVCWEEMDYGDELRLVCEEPILRGFERNMRRTLYKEKHFPVDFVIDPEYDIPMALTGTGFNVGVRERILAADKRSSVVAHEYIDQFQSEEDLEKLKYPDVRADDKLNAFRMEVAAEVFHGIMPFSLSGAEVWIRTWDLISMWRGVTPALYDLADRPEFMHALVKKITDITSAYFDQIEERGYLCKSQSSVHCTGAYTDELPCGNSERFTTADMWVAGLAQMLSGVSPEMQEEFEINYVAPLCARFGLVYYGCCEPLDAKLDIVKKLPNLRKVSMSPWVNPRRGAEGLGNKYVYSCKPNPALLAWESFDPEAVRRELSGIKKVCEECGTPLEFILKDISTVRREPQRVWQWAQIAMEVANS